MDRSEPALVPEWLKGGGSLPPGGNTSHISASTSQPFDDHPASKLAQNKSSLSGLSRDTSVLERTTSAYLRRSYSGNGFAPLRSAHSFGRSQRDRDWEDVSEYSEKDKLFSRDNRHYDHSDAPGNILPSKLDKDKFRPSQTQPMITVKQDNTWSKKVSSDLINSNKERDKNSNGIGLIPRVGAVSVHDSAFEQDFPSLGAEERQGGIARVSSPGLSAALQTGTAPMVVGENWKSALADVPVVMGNNLGHVSAQQAVPATSATMVPNVITGLKMAEALAQAPPRTRTPPQATAGVQRFEELAIRQSKLIPMTPSTAKTLAVSSSDKTRPKIGLQQQHPAPLVNHSHGVGRSDTAKVSNEGRLQVLKSSRELNGISSAVKDTLSPNGSKVVNSSAGITPLVVGSTPLRSSGHSPNHANAEHHPAVFRRPTMEKRPTSQVQSRNEFFNDLKKKSSVNSNTVVSDPNPSPQSSIPEMSGESVKEVVPASVPPDQGVNSSSISELSSENSSKKYHNGDAFPGPHQFGKGEKDPYPDVTPNPDEEEAAFLRSLGWEENADEDEGLTEEEIRAFYEEYMKLRPSLKLHGLQPAMRLNSHISTRGVDSSSALSSSDSDSDSDSDS